MIILCCSRHTGGQGDICRSKERGHHAIFWYSIPVTVTVDSNTLIQKLVLVPPLSWQDSSAREAAMAFSTTACGLCKLRRWISLSPSCWIRAWFPVLNSFLPRRADNMCIVITPEDFQFYYVYRVGLGIARPSCLTERQVIPCIKNLAVAPWKRSERKEFWMASWTSPNPSWCLGWHAGFKTIPDEGTV